MVKVGKKWFYSGKSSSNRAKVVVFGQSGCIWEGLLYSGKTCCSRANVVVFGKKWLYSGKMVVFWQKRLYSSKVVVFGLNSVVFGL